MDLLGRPQARPKNVHVHSEAVHVHEDAACTGTCTCTRVYRSVRSSSESGSGSGSESESIPVLYGTWPSWTAPTSPPSRVRSTTRFLMSDSHHASIHTAQVMSHRSVRPPLPLAFLASWRLNSPAFTHPADRIKSKWTVHPAMAGPIRGTAKTPRTPRRLRAWRRSSLAPRLGMNGKSRLDSLEPVRKRHAQARP